MLWIDEDVTNLPENGKEINLTWPEALDLEGGEITRARIHGKENFPIAFTTESDDIYDDEDSSKSTMQETAYLLLVEVLQKLIREKVYTI